MAENFGIGGMGLNPLSSMLDSVEMVKRAWSSFNLPAGMAPTLDPEELERRIKDLRTVEQWLTVNLGMLQSTIQALEAQRSAIVAMQAFGDAMKPSGPKPSDSPKAPDAPQHQPRQEAAPAPAATSAAEALANAAAAVNPAGWWQMLRTQFEQVANAALGASAATGQDQQDSPPQRPAGEPGKRARSTAAKRPARSGTPRRKPSAGG